MNKTKFILWLILPVLSLSSCTDDSFVEDSSGKKTNKATIRVTLQMPAAAPRTYAISEIDENHVETVDVLAFKQVTPDAQHPSGWTFVYSAKGTAITNIQDNNPNKAKKQFDITLIKDKSNEQCLVVLANVRTQLEDMEREGITAGADKDALLKRFVFANAGSWNANNDNSKAEGDADRFMPFPMWGEIMETVDDATTQIGSVTMLRGIVRLDVVLGNGVVTAGNFLLDEIYVYNSKNKGQVVPDKTNLATPTRVKNATVPEGSINNGMPLVYPVPSTMKKAFERTVYLFEAKAVSHDKSSEATCVVVGGTYGTDSKTTYYRLDFFESDGKTYRDLLRNFLYRINIISVSGSGYPTPEDAFNSKPLNMKAEVKIWDDASMGNVIFDGQYLLAVSQAEFEVPREEKIYRKLTVNTDYPEGWEAKVTSGEAWLTLDGNPKGGIGTNPLSFKVKDNIGGSLRTGIIRIVAGRLSYEVKVSQTDKPGLEIRTSADALEFPNYNIQQQSLTIDWEPYGKPCQLYYSSSYGGVFLETIVPSVISGGHYELGIKPKEITADELKNNPFLTKESKLKITATSDEGISEVKDITVRQTNYTVVPEIDDFYQMDGKTYSFKIRSNAIWRVEEITDEKNVLESTSLHIGNQKGAGETTVTITLKNDMANEGKIGSAKVRYRIRSTQNKFKDVTFEINAVSAYIIRAADVPKNGEEGGLDQDLLVQLKDLQNKTTWFGYNNRSSASPFSHVDPPGAPQDNPVNPKSCAALTTGGFNDWRMPSMREQLAIFTYIRSTGGNFKYYNFVNNSLVGASTVYSTSTQDGEASGNYLVSVHPSNPEVRHGLNTYTYYSLKTYDSLNARCVRTIK